MKILIVKTSSLGDLIHVFPVVDYLSQRYKECQIDWVVEKPFAALVKAHPLVSNVLTVNTKLWRKGWWRPSVWREAAAFRSELQRVEYDLVLDLQGNTKSGVITGLSRARDKVGFAKEVVPELPNLLFTNRRFGLLPGKNIRQDYLSVAQAYFQDLSAFQERGVTLSLSPEEHEAVDDVMSELLVVRSERVLVASGSMWPNKQLSSESLAGFLKLLHAQRPRSFLFSWGSAAEKEVADELAREFPGHATVLPKLSLPALQNLMGKMDLVVAMDSLPLHLAGTTGVATFSAFGASSSAKYKPMGTGHVALQGACPYGRVFEKRCPALRTCPTGLCIKGVTAEALFAAYSNFKAGAGQ